MTTPFTGLATDIGTGFRLKLYNRCVSYQSVVFSPSTSKYNVHSLTTDSEPLFLYFRAGYVSQYFNNWMFI